MLGIHFTSLLRVPYLLSQFCFFEDHDLQLFLQKEHGEIKFSTFFYVLKVSLFYFITYNSSSYYKILVGNRISSDFWNSLLNYLLVCNVAIEKSKQSLPCLLYGIILLFMEACNILFLSQVFWNFWWSALVCVYLYLSVQHRIGFFNLVPHLFLFGSCSWSAMISPSLFSIRAFLECLLLAIVSPKLIF